MSKKNKFSVGYNNDLKGFINLMKKHNDKIKSIYFPIPEKYMGSGRAISQKPYQEYIADIIKLMKVANSLSITPIMLLNATVFDYSKTQEVLVFLRDLYKKKLLDRIVVTNPFLITRIKRRIPKMKIEVSIMAYVRTIQEAKYFKELGASVIAISREEIRNVKLIEEMSKIIRVKVLVNEGCMKNCIYRYMHYNDLSNNMIKEHGLRAHGMCLRHMFLQPYKIFSSPFIRPEDLKYYNRLNIDYKISTRNWPNTKQIEKCLLAYHNEEFDGNLVELLNSVVLAIFKSIDNKKLNEYNFFETLSNCNENCNECTFCKKLFDETVVINDKVYEKYRKINEYYKK